MSVYTAPQPHQVTATTIGLGVAGFLVATAATFMIVDALDDSAAPVAPEPIESRFDPNSGARDSWEGRIGPGRERGGVRDSWMPPGATDENLDGGLHRP